MTSKLVDRTLSYMATGVGAVPVRIFFSLSSEPLRFRTFGDKPTDGGDLNDKHFDKFFSGSYLITIVAAGVANKVLHAAGTTQTFYTDKAIADYFRRHGLDECGIWDCLDTDALNNLSADARWAYSASKPLAIIEELTRARGNGQKLPLLFQDTDLVLRQSFDTILKRTADLPAIAALHIEEAATEFYPPFEKVTPSLPAKKFQLTQDGRLWHLTSDHIYRTNLPAANTGLMLLNDYDLAEEWAHLFGDMILNNFLADYDWLRGEQLLLACDQKTSPMVTDRRKVELATFLPISWTGTQFIDIQSRQTDNRWHFYHPHIANASYRREINHLWIEKGSIEMQASYSNFFGRLYLELLRQMCPVAKISWRRLEESLRSFPALESYFRLLDTGQTIEELLAEESVKPVEKRLIDNKLLRLSEPLIPEV